MRARQLLKVGETEVEEAERKQVTSTPSRTANLSPQAPNVTCNRVV